MPSYINIKNPIIEDLVNFDNTSNIAGRFGRQGKTNHPITNEIVDAETLWKNKYDGVMVSPEHKFNAEYVVGQPNQIKSAVGNNGMFDMSNPNIYKALVPLIGAGAAGATMLSKPEEENDMSNIFALGGLMNHIGGDKVNKFNT